MTKPQKNSAQRQAFILLAIAIGMFIFAVGILPPMYDAFCEWTGLNGKVDLTPAQDISSKQNISNNSESSAEKPVRKPVKVQFLARPSDDLPWKFTAQVPFIKVTPGERYQTYFIVENLSDKTISGKAIPSISPAQASAHLRKIECFCFMEQELKPKERKEMSLVFYLDEKFPETVEEMTLSYTLYPFTE
ncbi:MAG: cytochrome c oxidase assembly protein [Pseudomonadota bacterium]